MQLEINEESVCFLFLPHPLPPTFPFSILSFQFSTPLHFPPAALVGTDTGEATRGF